MNVRDFPVAIDLAVAEKALLMDDADDHRAGADGDDHATDADAARPAVRWITRSEYVACGPSIGDRYDDDNSDDDDEAGRSG